MSDHQELKLEVVVSHGKWVLGTDLLASGRATCTLTIKFSLCSPYVTIFNSSLFHSISLSCMQFAVLYYHPHHIILPWQFSVETF